MAIKIKIEHNLGDLSKKLERIKERAARIAIRQALNRTIMSTRTKTNKALREERKLKMGEINNKYTNVKRATGVNISKMEAEIKIVGKSLSLINFVRGSKLPRNQKGIKVRKRKALRFEVKPSQIKNKRGLFIARLNQGNIHVVRRVGNKMLPQRAPGLAQVFGRDVFNSPIKLFAVRTFKKEFGRAFSYQISRLT